MSGQDTDDLVRLDVAADELSVDVQTIRKYRRCGLLTCKQLPTGHWRVLRSSLDQVKRDQGIAIPDAPPGAGVYFVRCESFIKIGFSRHVSARLKIARTFSPFVLELLFFLGCTTPEEAEAREQYAHAALARYRHRGEWFVDCAGVRSYIESLRSSSQTLSN